jgi:hypothetical protein
MRSKKESKFRELFTGKAISAVRSVEEYERGEIFLTRMMDYEGQTFVFTDPKCFPAERKSQIREMIKDKFFLLTDDFTEPEASQYATFMKLAGPYWMSCVIKDKAAPILPPDHYRTYLNDRR